MKKQDWIIVILIITIASMGLVIRDMSIVKEDPVKYIDFKSGSNYYHVLADSEYLCEAVEDGFYIMLDNVNGRKVVECVTDDDATASEWAESIRMYFDE